MALAFKPCLCVHSQLPGLKFLDSRPVTEKERAEAGRVGQFMKVVTVTAEDVSRRTSFAIYLSTSRSCKLTVICPVSTQATKHKPNSFVYLVYVVHGLTVTTRLQMDAELRRQADSRPSAPSQFSPLPQESRSAENHRGELSTC